MREFLHLYGSNQPMQFRIDCLQECQLVLQVAVNGALDGFRADPDHVAAAKRCQKTKHIPTKAPERHDAARSCLSRRHCIPEQAAMIYFIVSHLLKCRDNIRKQATCHPDLRTINANGAEFASMIDLENAPNRKSKIAFAVIARHVGCPSVS